jgi:class 3 adenylate cyclase
MTSISIGDGAILAAETDWSAIETLVREVHTRVQANNRGDRKRRISYRLAVHWGPVFPFTDLNDGINIAGEGINTVSRLLGVAKPGKPLVSAKARDHIVDGAPSAEDMFEPDTAKTVKHGLRISAYIYKGL